jgi:hemolysin activation/secretion protein
LAFVLTIGVGMAGHTDRAEADTAPACESDCFVLTGLSLQGVSAYPLADLAPVYADRLASLVGVDDLVRMADAITEHYRRDGYFLTRAVVAPADAASGIARIHVYEGYLGEVVVEGTGAAAVAGLLRPLEQRRILTIGELDRRLALAADVPGVRLSSRIEPVIDDPARHRLVVTADLDRVEAGVFVENRGPETQGPWQVYGWSAANSVVAPGDRLSVAVLTTPEDADELTWAEAAWSVPVASHTRVRASVSGYSTSAPPGSSGWLSGRSQSASLAVSHQLVRRKDRSVAVTASLEVRRVEQAYAGGQKVEERLTVARVRAAAQRTAPSGWVSGWTQASRGLDALDATTRPAPGQTRADATGQFTKVNAAVTAYRDVGRHAGVYVSASAQWSDDPLLGSEEFYVGGSEVGRAFSYGELGGDSGVAGVIELRVGTDPPGAAVSFIQLYGFVEGGRVWNHTPAGRVAADLASAGAGARVTFGGRSTVRVELARPISGRPLDDPDGGWRAFVSLSRAF